MRIASQVLARWRMDLSPAEILAADTVALMAATMWDHLTRQGSGRPDIGSRTT